MNNIIIESMDKKFIEIVSYLKRDENRGFCEEYHSPICKIVSNSDVIKNIGSDNVDYDKLDETLDDIFGFGGFISALIKIEFSKKGNEEEIKKMIGDFWTYYFDYINKQWKIT